MATSSTTAARTQDVVAPVAADVQDRVGVGPIVVGGVGEGEGVDAAIPGADEGIGFGGAGFLPTGGERKAKGQGEAGKHGWLRTM